jgi:hypothetical protein
MVTTVVAVAALVIAAVALLGWWRAGRRLSALEARVGRLDREVHDDLVPTIDLTRRESEEAYVAARMAKQAAGIEEPPPRLAGEAVTGPVVRAVAFGAGARRALARFAADATPMAKTRASTVRTVKIVGTASRVRPGRAGKAKAEPRAEKRRAG